MYHKIKWDKITKNYINICYIQIFFLKVQNTTLISVCIFRLFKFSQYLFIKKSYLILFTIHIYDIEVFDSTIFFTKRYLWMIDSIDKIIKKF